MTRRLRKSARLCAALLATLFLAAGCARPAGGAAAFLPTSLVLQAAPQSASQAVLDYLETAQGDFSVIDSLLADRNLDLLSQQSSGGDESMTTEQAEDYLSILSGYDSKLAEKLSDIEHRTPPENPDIASFTAAETAELRTAFDIVQEYEQVLKYYEAVLAMSGDMKFDGLDSNDLEGAYETIHNGIGKAIGELNSTSVPSFLQSTNDTFVASLGSMDDAVLYYLQAISINDPVRMSAANYRYDILTRKLDTIGNAFEQDITARDDKLKADLLAIQSENDSLKDWVQQNIEKLNGN